MAEGEREILEADEAETALIMGASRAPLYRAGSAALG